MFHVSFQHIHQQYSDTFMTPTLPYRPVLQLRADPVLLAAMHLAADRDLVLAGKVSAFVRSAVLKELRVLGLYPANNANQQEQTNGR
jgi:hypothetical protein